MQVRLVRKTSAGTQLNLDADALGVLSAALKFTSKLNPRCEELARQFEKRIMAEGQPPNGGQLRQL